MTKNLRLTDITYGGFFRSNIHQWIIRECLYSGDPANFLLAVREEIERIAEQASCEQDYWERKEAEDGNFNDEPAGQGIRRTG